MMMAKIGFIISGTNESGNQFGFSRVMGLNEEAYGSNFFMSDLRGLFTCNPYVGSSIYTLRCTGTEVVYSLLYLLDGRPGTCRQFGLAIPVGMKPTGISVYALLNLIRDTYIRFYTIDGKVLRGDAKEDMRLFEELLDRYPLQEALLRKRPIASSRNNRFGVIVCPRADIEGYLATPLRTAYRDFQEIYLADNTYSFSMQGATLLNVSVEESVFYSIYYEGQLLKKDVPEDEWLNLTLKQAGYEDYVVSGTIGMLRSRPELAKIDEENERVTLTPLFKPIETEYTLEFVDSERKPIRDISRYCGDFYVRNLTNERECLYFDAQGKILVKGEASLWVLDSKVPERYGIRNKGSNQYEVEVYQKNGFVLRFDENSAKPKSVLFSHKRKQDVRKQCKLVERECLVELDGDLKDWKCEIQSDYYETRNLTDLKACEKKTLSLKPMERRVIRFRFTGDRLSEALEFEDIELSIDNEKIIKVSRDIYDYQPRQQKKNYEYHCALKGYEPVMGNFCWGTDEVQDVEVNFIPRWTNGLLRKVLPLLVCILLGGAIGFFANPLIVKKTEPEGKGGTELISKAEYDSMMVEIEKRCDLLNDSIEHLWTDTISHYKNELEDCRNKGAQSSGKGTNSAQSKEAKALDKFEKALPNLKTGDDLADWEKENEDVFKDLSLANRILIHRVTYAAYDSENQKYMYNTTQKKQAMKAFTDMRKNIQSINDLKNIPYPTGIQERMRKKDFDR